MPTFIDSFLSPNDLKRKKNLNMFPPTPPLPWALLTFSPSKTISPHNYTYTLRNTRQSVLFSNFKLERDLVLEAHFSLWLPNRSSTPRGKYCERTPAIEHSLNIILSSLPQIKQVLMEKQKRPCDTSVYQKVLLT